MKKQSWAFSFRCALNGIFYALSTQRNMRVHALMTLVVLGWGWYFSISRLEWVALILTIGMVLTAELINTALEKAVDLITLKRHPLAGLAKDLAAGAVLVTAIIAVIVGVLIFFPYLR